MNTQKMNNPILVLGYQRYENLIKIVNNFSNYKGKIFISLDFYKSNSTEIDRGVFFQKIRDANLDLDISIIQHRENLGLRRNVEFAVNWVFNSGFESVIVVEDDSLIRCEGIALMNAMLETFKNSPNIGHVSVYNRVPKNRMCEPAATYRLSFIPETKVWGTWKNRWEHYPSFSDPHEIFKNYRNELYKAIPTRSGRISWTLSFLEAKYSLLDSWAYRWLLTMWRNNLMCVTTNINYVHHINDSNGTHASFLTRLKKEQPVSMLMNLNNNNPKIDPCAEKWILTYDAYGHFLILPFRFILFIGLVYKKVTKLLRSF